MTIGERSDQVPPYAAETEREIRKLGLGGDGNFESAEDAADRGVTKELAEETRKRTSQYRSPEKHSQAVRDKAEELRVLAGDPNGDLEHYIEMAESLLTQRPPE